jgi:hypothetical protein
MCTKMLFIIFILLLTIIFLIIYNKNIESYNNLESNLYSYDTCCTEKQIRKCETYGKTGVCNYNQDNMSCLCQESF